MIFEADRALPVFAKRMEEEEAHELRKKMNLGEYLGMFIAHDIQDIDSSNIGEGEVNMGELLGEKNKIASGETTAVDSALDELRSR